MGNKGLLPTKKDKRDLESSLGGSFMYKPKMNERSFFTYQFTQRDNICTAAGAALAISEQTGIRWSVKALMRMMVKEGMVTGNGFSYQRAPLKIITKYGLIPYHLMPDENDRGWEDYSKWDEETARLYRDIAPKYKFTEYKKLSNEVAVLEALDSSYVPITASSWYSGMNRPEPSNYFLDFVGGYVGGHQYRITGYRRQGADFETPQSFGENYGDHGKAWSKTVFGKGYFDNWILEYNGTPTLPIDVLLPLFIEQQEGKLVRSPENSKCYIIEKGKKRYVSGEDNMATFFHLQKEKGLTYVKHELLIATPNGVPYPFI